MHRAAEAAETSGDHRRVPARTVATLGELAGNQVVRRVLGAGPRGAAAAGAPSLQMYRDTVTNVPTDVLPKLYKNHVKGDPPFKPQKGNFGKVSWFAGTGNPYIGGKAQQGQPVDVRIEKDPSQLDTTFFATTIAAGEVALGKDRTLQDDQHDLWVYLGSQLQGYRVAEVHIPKGPMSRSGQGTFISVNAAGREEISLRDPAAVRQLVPNPDAIDQAFTGKEGTNAPSFTIALEFTTESAPTPNGILGTIRSAMPDATVVLTGLAVTRTMPPPAAPDAPLVERLRARIPTYRATGAISAASYAIARRAAKQLATNEAVLRAKLKANSYDLTITPGQNWKASAVRSYTANY